jgi:hypothetical protein
MSSYNIIKEKNKTTASKKIRRGDACCNLFSLKTHHHFIYIFILFDAESAV